MREGPSDARGVTRRDPQPNSPAGSNGAALESVGGTADTAASGPVQDVGIDHRRFQILVSKQLLDGPDIISLVEEVGGKGVPKRVTAHGFLDSNLTDGLGRPALNDPILQVVPPLDTRARVLAPARGWEKPLPAPLDARAGVSRGRLNSPHIGS